MRRGHFLFILFGVPLVRAVFGIRAADAFDPFLLLLHDIPHSKKHNQNQCYDGYDCCCIHIKSTPHKSFNASVL